MPKFSIKNRWTGAVKYTCELTAEAAGLSASLQLGFAAKSAVVNGAELRDADMRDADLRGADLREADMRDADLRDADLRDADMRDADLRDADLRGADLVGAYLRDADLRGARLRDADLREADMRDADLRGADMRHADLRDADLRGARLGGADLGDADMGGADMRDADLRYADMLDAELGSVKQDFLAEVLRLPDELEFLRSAIAEGRIDGSTYNGDCACLSGTLAKSRHPDKKYSGYSIEVAPGVIFHAASRSPREVFFTAISPGDTPENNPAAAIALAWTNEAIAIRDMIRATAPSVDKRQL